MLITVHDKVSRHCKQFVAHDFVYQGAKSTLTDSLAFGWGLNRGVLKKCVNSQAVYPLSEQHGLEAQERRYTAHEEGKH